MKKGRFPKGSAARYIFKADNAKTTAPASAIELPTRPSFAQLLAEQSLHLCWEYRLHGYVSARVMFPHGATRDEVLRHLELRFPGAVVERLWPVGGGDR